MPSVSTPWAPTSVTVCPATQGTATPVETAMNAPATMEAALYTLTVSTCRGAISVSVRRDSKAMATAVVMWMSAPLTLTFVSMGAVLTWPGVIDVNVTWDSPLPWMERTAEILMNVATSVTFVSMESVKIP